MSTLVIVFVVQLVLHLLSTAGSTAINNLLWTIYSRFPTPQAKQARHMRQLRGEVVTLNRDMSNTSAQDDFAKWAKLRRQHDKKKEEYDKKSRELQDFRSSFDRIASGLKWVGTTGARYVLQYKFSKRAMFWIPRGWLPYPVEWIVSFPSAPLGSISINMWWIACATVIGLLSEGIIALWTAYNGDSSAEIDGEEKIKVQTPGRGTPTASSSPLREKKEL